MGVNDGASSMFTILHQNERDHGVFNFRYFAFHIPDPNWTGREIM